MAQSNSTTGNRRMRSACDRCHSGKLRCFGNPCSNCLLYNQKCVFSLSDPLGRPKGVKNRRNGRTTSRDASSETNNAEVPPPSEEDRNTIPMSGVDSGASNWDMANELTNGGFSMPTSSPLDYAGELSQQLAALTSSHTPFGAFEMDDPNFDFFSTSQPASTEMQGPHQHIDPSLALFRQTDLAQDHTSLGPLCTCLQTQANLLAYIREISSRAVVPVPIHILLQSARRSLEAMKHVCDCQYCLRRGISEEILLLVATASKKVLRLYQNSGLGKHLTCAAGRGRDGSVSAPPSGLQTPVSMSTSLGSSVSGVLTGAGAAGCDGVGFENSTLTNINDYLLDGDDVDLVGRVLALRNLRRLVACVSTLLEQTSQTAAGDLGYMDGSDTPQDLMKEVLQALNPMTDHLEQSLQWGLQ